LFGSPSALLRECPLDMTRWIAAPGHGTPEYKEFLKTARESPYEWVVSGNSGRVVAKLRGEDGEGQQKPDFPLGGKEVPEDIRDSAQRAISIRVDDGWLVAYNAGEWGAALWWYSQDGKRNYRISSHPVEQFIRRKNGLVAVAGLAHLTINEGSVISLAREDGKWTARPLAVLPQAGRVATPLSDGGLVVVTSTKLVRVSKEGKVRTLIEDTGYLPAPNSVAIGPQGAVYIGMRRCVGVYEPESKELKLFVPTKAWLDAADQQKRKLNWAREILIDFLDAAVESRSSAIGLLTPELAKAVENDKSADFLGLIRLRKYGQPTIEREDLAPGGTEAVFVGTVTGKRDDALRTATFKVRIAMDTKDGKWCIRYVLIKEKETAAQPDSRGDGSKEQKR